MNEQQFKNMLGSIITSEEDRQMHIQGEKDCARTIMDTMQSLNETFKIRNYVSIKKKTALLDSICLYANRAYSNDKLFVELMIENPDFVKQQLPNYTTNNFMYEEDNKNYVYRVQGLSFYESIIKAACLNKDIFEYLIFDFLAWRIQSFFESGMYFDKERKANYRNVLNKAFDFKKAYYSFGNEIMNGIRRSPKKLMLFFIVFYPYISEPHLKIVVNRLKGYQNKVIPILLKELFPYLPYDKEKIEQYSAELSSALILRNISQN